MRNEKNRNMEMKEIVVKIDRKPVIILSILLALTIIGSIFTIKTVVKYKNKQIEYARYKEYMRDCWITDHRVWRDETVWSIAEDTIKEHGMEGRVSVEYMVWLIEDINDIPSGNIQYGERITVPYKPTAEQIVADKNE